MNSVQAAAPALLKVEGLSRSFGTFDAVSDVSFDIRPGEVVGFIGANGAGKTTTMRIIATLDEPTSGAASICGYDTVAYSNLVRPLIGWMPDSYGRYNATTVHEYLDFYARAFGYRGDERRQRVGEVMEFTDLTPIAEKEIDVLSKGMAQRLCLGRILLHEPKLLIMDEPAAGLDPRARIEFKHLVRLLAQEGKAIFISSHILSELEDMCDSLLFIDKGTIVHKGSIASLKKRSGTETIVRIVLDGDPAKLEEWILLSPGVRLVTLERNGCLAAIDTVDPSAISGMLRRMLNDGLRVVDFHQQEQRLEEAFISMLEKLERGTD